MIYKVVLTSIVCKTGQEILIHGKITLKGTCLLRLVIVQVSLSICYFHAHHRIIFLIYYCNSWFTKSPIDMILLNLIIELLWNILLVPKNCIVRRRVHWHTRTISFNCIRGSQKPAIWTYKTILIYVASLSIRLRSLTHFKIRPTIFLYASITNIALFMQIATKRLKSLTKTRWSRASCENTTWIITANSSILKLGCLIYYIFTFF